MIPVRLETAEGNYLGTANLDPAPGAPPVVVFGQKVFRHGPDRDRAVIYFATDEDPGLFDGAPRVDFVIREGRILGPIERSAGSLS